ncbi:hypothetical protein PYCCODRAFT_1481692 [Trametes coccinea BRFM310]|uniref:Uncharacterized protein n=1 Tax=Trametes coccinea (strain BRFM310) TaxID=1353009 RepID=A0A1Y2I913_TRAC3|nr:hypothetical protein PYCCODRAFT_1481692 [Trametes coccinea BRFM310]
MDPAKQQPTPTSPSALLKRLRETLTEAPSFCNGTLQLPREDFRFYYGKKQARYVDFAEVAQDPSAIQALQNACEAAPFGRNEETVLKETYRKAGKMDADNFMRFDAERAGHIEIVRQGLLTGSDETKGIKSELYKLNVYAALEHPALGRDVRASLVVVLPTPHQWGELILRHDWKEWTVDSSCLLAGVVDRIAFVAFFSDVEHECRVAIKDALLAYLRNPKVLPEGGLVGFGLRHAYPVPRSYGDPMTVVKKGLKGSDAALYQACEALGLSPRLRLFMEEDEGDFMFDSMQRLAENTYDSDDSESADGSDDWSPYKRTPPASDNPPMPVYWVTQRNSQNATSQAYVSHGNEACLSHFYVQVALVADAKASRERLAEWGVDKLAKDIEEAVVREEERSSKTV